jgi:RimJ/RimL family protein N-acetyltransferase
MPTYAQHIKFIESKPYSKWYVIKFNNKKIGSVYLSKQNEVGIFIKKNMHSQKLGTSVLNILMKKNHRKRYLANINPKNKKSIGFFKKNGFELLQYTFELKKV